MSSVSILGKAFGKPCEVTASSDPLCLHLDSTRAPTITEVLEVEKKSNGVVTTVIGLCENFKHLVNPTHDDDKDFDSVVKLVEQGYKLRKSDWEQGFVDVFLTAEDIGQQRGNEDKDVQQKYKEQAQDEEEQQLEAEAEVGEGDKERETSKANEGHTVVEEEDEQMEADTEVEEPVQVERQKRGRGNKEQAQDEEEQQLEAEAEVGEGNKERETSKANEGHTVVEEEDEQMEADTKMREPVQVERQKRGRGNKEQAQDEEEQLLEAEAEVGEGDKERETSKANEGHTVVEEEDEQMEADTEVEEPVQVERQKRERGNKEQAQDEEEQQLEAEAEVGEGDKERETSKANEGHTVVEEEDEQMEADTEVEEPVQVERQKRGRRNKEKEHRKNEEKRKYDAYEKNKEKDQGEDGSRSNSEKLDKLIRMVYDLGKRVEIIQNVLGVKVFDGSPNDDNEDHQNAANPDYAKSSPSYDNEEESNYRVKRCATDDENGEEICDEEEISDTHQLTQVNTLGENENTEKITSNEETEKMEEESCSKQKSKVTSSTPTFTTPNFETRVTSPTPTFTTPKFDLLSQESRHSGKGANEYLMRDVGEKSVSQPLMETKKRLVQQDIEVNDDVEPPLKKKNKADIGNVELRRSERGQIPSIHTQPPFTGARKKHPIVHPFEPVDKTRKEKMTEWKMSNKNKKLIINEERVNEKWFSDLETPGTNLSKTHIEAGLQLLKLRKRNNPDLFLNKTALVVGVKFLEEIDELYVEFLDDKEGFQFASGFDKYNIEKNITFLYSAIAVEEYYWLGIVVNLEKRSITAFNSASVKGFSNEK
ncbi:uncharacterized protein LOC108850329 [Raphanus sativus]|uniref:Uncharacterized protein LOC108850329 n=1 Tax=Raphanus sativus TaxID=3726 RepID=A0A9W3DK08_RAPSA|nr:uncharacterized protein LOC108850329 [Raphanus sativus]